MDKKLILVNKAEIDIFEIFHGESLESSIDNLILFKDKLSKEGLIIGKVDVDQHYDYLEVSVNLYREETDEEYQIRIQKELERAEKDRLKKEKAAALKLERQRAAELKELSELEALRQRVAELEKKHNK